MANQIKYQVGFDVDKSSLNQIKTSLQQLSRVKLSDIMKINNVDAQQARKILDDVKEKAKQVETALTQAFNVKLNTANIQEFKNKLGNLNINELYSSFSKLGAAGEIAFRQVSTQLLNTNVRLRQSHTLLDKMGTTFLNTIKWNIASSAINAMSRSIQQAWGFTKELDTSLNDIRIVTGKSADEMANFAEKANQAAQNLGQTTTNYTKASLIYYQQGLQDGEVQARTDVTLKAANVTGQSAQQVSEQLTAVWNGYKVSAEQTEVYIDRLAAVAATSASNLEELSTGMSKVASAAAAMGVSEEQLAAQLSTIISVTRQAPQSVGTALRTVFARVADIKAGVDEEGVSLGNYSSKMAELGISVLDMNGNLRDMGEVMEQIGGKWADMSREQQVYLARTMAGQRQYNNLLALFDNFDMYNKQLEVAQNATGTLQKQQDTYMESTEAHLKQLRAALEGVYEKAVNTKSINNLIDGLKIATNFMSQFIQSLGGGGAALSSLGSIAFMVFSKQIGESLSTTINNMRAAKEQTEYFNKALLQAQTINASGAGNTYTKDLENKQEQLMTLGAGGNISTEQFEIIKNSLLELRQAADQLDIANQKVDLIKTSFKGLMEISPTIDSLIGDINNLEEILNTTDSEHLVQQLTKLQTTFALLNDPINQVSNKWGSFVVAFKAGKLNTSESIAELENLQTELINFVDGIDDETFAKLPEAMRWSLTETANALKEIDLTRVEDPKKTIQDYFNKIIVAIKQKQQQVQTALKVTTDPKQSLDQAEQQQQQAQGKYNDKLLNTNTILDDAATKKQMQNITAVTSGITSMAMAVKNFQNLGNIWANQDLSVGEKLLQTILNLSMGIGMLIPAFSKLNGVLGIAKVMKLQDAAAAGVEIATNKKLAISFTEAGIQAQFFNTVLEMNPVVAIIAVFAALIAILGALANAYEEARKAAIERDKATIEEQNKKQQEIEKNKELYSSMEDLNQKYKEGTITRAELRDGIDDLLSRYNLEQEQIDELIAGYGDLTEAIRKKRAEEAEEGYQSARNENQAAEDRLKKQLQTVSEYDSEYDPGYTRIEMPTAGDVTEAGKIIRSQLGDMFAGNGIRLGIDMDSYVAFYDRLTTTLQKAAATSDELESAEYQRLLQWKDAWSQAIEEYKQSLQDMYKYATEIAALTAESNGLDLNSIKTGNDYYQARLGLVKAIQQAQQLDPKDQGYIDANLDAEKLADTYIKENYKDTYFQFGKIGELIDGFEEKFGSVNNEVVSMIDSLSDTEIGMLLSLEPDVITGWEDLRSIIEYIVSQNFDNLNINAPTTEQYKQYNELGEKISSNPDTGLKQEDYDALAPEIQAFFDMSADGLYRMTKNIFDFQDTIKNFSLKGFEQETQRLKQSNENLKQYQSGAFTQADYDKLAQGPQFAGQTGYMNGTTSAQLDFLKTMGYDQDKITNWEAQLADGTALASTFGEITNAVRDYDTVIQQALSNEEGFSEQIQQNIQTMQANALVVARSAESIAELNSLLYQGAITQQAYAQAAFEMHEAERMQDLNVDEIQNYADYLQDLANSEEKAYIGGEKLSKDVLKNEDAARDLAIQISRMNKGVQDLADNWDDWSDVLKNSSKGSDEYYEASQGVKDALADLLDISSDYISLDFVDKLAQTADGMELMQRAAEGDGEAIDQLRALSLQDFVMHLQLDDSKISGQELFSRINDIQSMLDAMGPIQAGAVIDTSGVDAGQAEFIDALNQMILDAGMGVNEVNEMLARMGFEGNYASEPQEVVQTIQHTNKHHIITNYVQDPKSGAASWDEEEIIDPPSYETVTGTVENFAYQASEPGTVSVPKLNSVTKKAGGSANNYSGSNRGGSGGSKGSGGKGGGGGGSGKGSEPDKSQKDKKKPVEDTRDIYHDINIQLKQIERQLNRVQDIQDRLYGKQLLDNLNKQTEILERQKEKLEEKRKIQLQDLADQREKLKTLKVEFDEYDNIKNYMSILAAGQKEVNKLTDQYNALVDKYNASTDKDYKKTVADEIEEFSKKLKEAEDNYKELEEKIKDYDSLREDMEDLIDDIDEIVQQEVELNITRFNMQLDIRLNMAQAERDWNEFKRNVIYKDNILKDTGFDTIFKDAMHSLDDVYTYFSTAGSKSIIQNLTEQLLNTRTEIEAIDSEGWSEIYGDDKAQAMENLKDNFDELIGQMQDMEELINEIDEAYLDTIDDVKDQFDKQIEDYEFIGELLQHDMDLLELLYGDKNYAAMDRYYAQLNQNNLQQLDSLRKQSQLWYEYWQAAVAEGNVADAAKFEENYREAINNLNSLIEESAENLKDKYINSVEQIFNELDRKISNGKGTDYLSMEWDLMNKNADEYLDTINSAFAVQELQSKYQKAINDTKNIRNQQTLKKLMDAQLENLRAKEKLTQYDVERAEKLLQIEQARMALQDAKASKTTMRLKRNAQGNYSYEYVADNSGVAEAQDALAAAQNDLYNFDKDRYNSNLEDILAAWKDFQSEYKEIIEDTSLTEEDRVARLALLREEYGEYINDKTAENLVIRNNLMESAFMDIAALYNVDVENYQQMADDEKEILMGDLVPTWKSGIQEMTNTVVGSGGFLPTCEKAFDNITKATQKYERQLETMSRVAGTNLNMVKNGIDILADSTKTLIEDNDALIDRLTDEIDTIKDLKLEVENLRKQYEDVTKEANKAADAIHNFIKAQEDQAAKEAEKEAKKKAEQNKNNNTSSGGSGSGGTAQKTTLTSNNNNNNTSNTSANRSKYLDYTFKNNWPGRDFYLSGKYVGSFNGSGFTTKDAEIIQDMIDNGIWGKNYSAGAWPIYKSKTKTIDELLKSYGLKTGGYTGDWAGDSGRLALLHQKELVLNQEDTQNILDSVTILRQLLSSATGNIANRMFSLNNKNSIMQSLFGEGLEQNVHIDATFPNVNSKKEIEDAFNEIINLAAQKALK